MLAQLTRIDQARLETPWSDVKHCRRSELRLATGDVDLGTVELSAPVKTTVLVVDAASGVRSLIVTM